MIYELQPGDLQALLDLADNPRRDVKTTTATPQMGVVISEELYQRLLTYKSLSESAPPRASRKKESQ